MRLPTRGIRISPRRTHGLERDAERVCKLARLRAAMSRRRQARRAAVATEDSLAVIDEAKLRAAFSVFDTDNSGTLSADELRAVLSKSGVGGRAPFTDEQIQALIDEFDDDGTGELHYAGSRNNEGA